MSWKVRHEGSPKHVDGLTPDQIVQALLDGQFEPTDEVQGPNDAGWTALDSHPQFAEIAAEIEPPQPTMHPDETRLDMNALIDVCLVLLIFFILTTAYAIQEMMHKAAGVARDEPGKIKIIQEGLDDTAMVHLSVTRDADTPSISVRVHTKKPGQGDASLQIRLADVFDSADLEEFKGQLQKVLEPLWDGGFRSLLIDLRNKGIPHELAVAIVEVAGEIHMDNINYKLPP